MPYLGRTPSAVPVTADDIPANSIDASKIIDGAIAVADIADDAITPAKISIMQSTATSNLGLGTGAVDSITTGDYNVGVGDNALTACTEGVANTATGYGSLAANTTASYNTAVGYTSLGANTTGTNNTASGGLVLVFNTTGGSNTASGTTALYTNTTGNHNTAFGHNALRLNTTAGSNTALGSHSLYNNTGSYNTASGYFSLFANTTGANNTANGNVALYNNTTGSGNTASGLQALYYNTTGANNTAVGAYSLFANTTAQYNVAVGRLALASQVGGGITQNVAVGNTALEDTTTGINNVALGASALGNNTTGGANTALGHAAGVNITTGNDNIIIGANISSPSATASNQLNIGNTIYGNTSTGKVGIGTSSPQAKLQVALANNNYGTPASTFGVVGPSSTGFYVGTHYDGGGAGTDLVARGYNATLGDFRFMSVNGSYASPVERMRINSAGNVRINNTDAGNYRLKIKYSGGGEEGIGLQTTFNGGGNMLRFVNYLNTVVGGVYSSNTSTSFNTSSDYRLKELDVPMEGSIDRLKLLRPINFAWKVDGSRTDGFFAHEAGEVVPECASGTKDAMTAAVLYTADDELPEGKAIGDIKEASVPDYQGIDQSKLVPLLVASLQEAIARIEVLENA